MLTPPRSAFGARLTAPARPPARAATAGQWWIGAGAALLCLLQVLALDVRNPLTRTLSSYEYTQWGWLFPAALVIFGIGIMVLAVRMDRTARPARMLLGGAAMSAWVTAAFPSGEHTTGGYWPGEVHRWGSIALMILVLGAALTLLRQGMPAATAQAMMRLVIVGSVAGLAFLAGQALKPAVPVLVGEAPLFGGLTQRILVAAVAAVLWQVAGRAGGPESSGRGTRPGAPIPQPMASEVVTQRADAGITTGADPRSRRDPRSHGDGALRRRGPLSRPDGPVRISANASG